MTKENTATQTDPQSAYSDFLPQLEDLLSEDENPALDHAIDLIEAGEPLTRHVKAAVQDALRKIQLRHRMQERQGWVLLSADDLLHMHEPDTLIDGMIVEGTLFNIFGNYGDYKSFLALDMALSIAADIEWQGREIKSGHVIYVAAEGAPGLRKRVSAWIGHHNLTKEQRAVVHEQFHVLGRSVDMVGHSEPKKLAELITKLGVNPKLIMLDTLARCFGSGDENSTKDMNRFIASCDELKKQFGKATIGIVHHVGKDRSKGARGASSNMAALDTSISVKAEKFAPDEKSYVVGAVTIYCDKQKDMEPFKDETFAMRRMCFADGGSSLVVSDLDVSTEQYMKEQKAQKSSSDDKQQQALKALDPKGMKRKDWLPATGLAERTFDRCRSALEASGKVEKRDGIYRPVME